MFTAACKRQYVLSERAYTNNTITITIIFLLLRHKARDYKLYYI